MMWWYDGGGAWHPWMAVLMWVGMILFGALVVGGVLYAVRGWDRGRPAAGGADPEAVLKERLARGEIDSDEYRRIRELIRSGH